MTFCGVPGGKCHRRRVKNNFWRRIQPARGSQRLPAAIPAASLEAPGGRTHQTGIRLFVQHFSGRTNARTDGSTKCADAGSVWFGGAGSLTLPDMCEGTPALSATCSSHPPAGHLHTYLKQQQQPTTTMRRICHTAPEVGSLPRPRART